MELPSPSTAPDAIRTIATCLRHAVRASRLSQWSQRRAELLDALRQNYEKAPRDEFVVSLFPPVGDAENNESTYVASGPDMPALEAWRFDRIAYRPRRRVRLRGPQFSSLPESWSAEFYEQVSWPHEPVREGAHQFRLFLEIGRGKRSIQIPIHDALDPWPEREVKAKAPGGFPIPYCLKYEAHIVVDDRASLRTYCQWLTVYLAQRMYLTNEEEGRAIRSFFSSRRISLENARYVAYERMKRRFVQPMAGRVSFSNYFWKSSEAALRQVSWQEQELLVDPASPFIDLKTLRIKEPALHRAVLHRIKLGAVTPVDVVGRSCVRSNEVERVDEERTANAEARSKSPYSISQRSDWLHRMQASGITLGAARRKLARWINTRGLTSEQIELFLTDGARRHRLGAGTGTR